MTGDDDLIYQVDLESGLTRLAEPHQEGPYEPPPKPDRETAAQVRDGLRRQRPHQLDLDIAVLRNRAATATTEFERLLARHEALGARHPGP